MSIYPAENVTDVSLDFTATLPAAEGTYDVILRDAQGAELGREALGITITPDPNAPRLDSIKPDETSMGLQDLVVTGVNLAGVDAAGYIETWQPNNSKTGIPVTAVSDTSFTFNTDFADAGVVDVVAYTAGVEVARLVGGLSVGMTRLTSADPSTFVEGVETAILLGGSGLANTTGLARRLHGSTDAYVTDSAIAISGVTAGYFTATGTFDEGVYDLAAMDAAGNVIASYDDPAITVTAAPLGVIDKVIPGTLVTTNATTLHAQGSGLATVDHVILTDAAGTASEVTVVGASDVEFLFDYTAAAVGTWTVTAKAGGATGTVVAELADAFTAIAAPTVPTVFAVYPDEVTAHAPTLFTIYGWLLDPGDCIGLDSENGSTNWSSLDFTNTGIVMPWENSLGEGTWNWHVKQGGSGGTTIASKTAAVISHPIELVSVVPDTASSGVETTYTITITGGAHFVGVIRLKDAATGVAQPDIAVPTDPPSNGTEIVFKATLPAAVYDIELWYWMLAQLLATIPDAITVTDAPPVLTGAITSIDPNDVVAGSHNFLVTGTGLSGTDYVRLEDTVTGAQTADSVVGNLTDTQFGTSIEVTEGTYHVLAIDGGVEFARGENLLTVTAAPVPPPVFTSVTPTSVEETRAATFTVVGTGLAQLTAVSLVEQGVAVVPVTPQGLSDTGFTFAWTPASGQTGPYDLVGDGPDQDAQLVNAVTVTPYVDTTPRIDTVDPTSTWVNHATAFTITGYGLLEVAAVRIGTSGVGFDDFLPQDFTTHTDTQIVFQGSITRTGLHDVIGNEMGGVAYLRKDDCLQINNQIVVARGTRIPASELAIECGTDAQTADRITQAGVTPPDPEAWEAGVFATVECSDGSTSEITWNGTIWQAFTPLTGGARATLTRGETKTARELGIGRCAVTRAGTAKRMNAAEVEADPPEPWGEGGCAYVLCNSGVHDEVRWNGTAWEECT